jgi:hypothetical protein
VIKAIVDTEELIRVSQVGGITLVLGSGISVSSGLPNWNSLAQDMWRAAYGRRRSPWRRLSKGMSPRDVPQFLPIVFELVRHELGEEQFLKALSTNLYRNARLPTRDGRFLESDETLAVLARLVVQEFKRQGNRRIERIVTLNADDLLEQAVSALVPDRYDVIWPVARPTSSAFRRPGSIPIYHIHGYLPSEGDYSGYMLVFTDSQYWSTSATALAFANRVMLSALNETRCVFIGLSMIDINLLRWLALRALEWNRDVEEEERLASELQLAAAGPIKTTAAVVRAKSRAAVYSQVFSQHFWIRPASSDPTGFLSEFLALRGIHSVELTDWTGPHFQRLMRKCFL